MTFDMQHFKCAVIGLIVL